MSESDVTIRLTFADETTLEGLVTNIDKSECRHEVNRLVSWCDNNNLQLNASKTRDDGR